MNNEERRPVIKLQRTGKLSAWAGSQAGNLHGKTAVWSEHIIAVHALGGRKNVWYLQRINGIMIFFL